MTCASAAQAPGGVLSFLRVGPNGKVSRKALGEVLTKTSVVDRDVIGSQNRCDHGLGAELGPHPVPKCLGGGADAGGIGNGLADGLGELSGVSRGQQTVAVRDEDFREAAYGGGRPRKEGCW